MNFEPFFKEINKMCNSCCPKNKDLNPAPKFKAGDRVRLVKPMTLKNLIPTLCVRWRTDKCEMPIGHEVVVYCTNSNGTFNCTDESKWRGYCTIFPSECFELVNVEIELPPIKVKIPDGYEYVDFSKPKEGESYIFTWGDDIAIHHGEEEMIGYMSIFGYNRIILRKIEKPAKEMTMEEVEKLVGCKVKIVK